MTRIPEHWHRPSLDRHDSYMASRRLQVDKGITILEEFSCDTTTAISVYPSVFGIESSTDAKDIVDPVAKFGILTNEDKTLLNSSVIGIWSIVYSDVHLRSGPGSWIKVVVDASKSMQVFYEILIIFR